ncbi:MAG TPA: hypothetical protein VG537_00255 [Candidatus Kapabacteria bacterium]|nr:hypothetical protein [Candidatus Kapabacteria bacterium]
MNNIQNNINRKIGKWRQAHIVGFSVFVLALSVALVLLIAGKSTKLRADDSSVIYLQSPTKILSVVSLKMPPAISKLQDEIPTTVERNVPVSDIGICKNAEVNLTDAQAAFVKAFNDYLISKGDYAIVTSGKRTSDQQLNIIKERVDERGASSKFPKLEEATIADTKIWLKAWQWLRRKHVPVNAPAAVPGADVAPSMHLKGLAIDFISSDLDNLRSWLASFIHSPYAKESKLQIVAIVREPGCVHVNLG